MKKIVLGLPKGSLQESTFSMLKKAGFDIKAGSRSYIPIVDDPEIDARLIRAQEMSRYVEQGMLDVGITGYDWIVENNSDVIKVENLVYAKQGLSPVRWVLAVPNESSIQSVKELEGKRVATEAVGLTQNYLAKHGVNAHVEFSWGATEVKTPELVDAIIEITETGSSLRANNLRIVETVLESTTQLIANKTSWKDDWKQKKIAAFALLLKGALSAETLVLIKMNVKKENIEGITSLLPSMHAPTINHLSTDNWLSIESVVEKSVVREIVPPLKKAGAKDIIEIGLNKVVP
ncbi:MAG: ATP phosphoribosyltransferase [Kiritimatiellae bacterium]|nr:ATP phosphoribosyltransferase [Kiritimatiellia bacterium]